MTRLTEDDVTPIEAGLADYDHQLVTATGHSLFDIGCRVSGVEDPAQMRAHAAGIKIAVVPINSGQGTITGFSRSVCGILAYLGFSAKVTDQTDVAGFTESFEWGARVIMASDDLQFTAFTPETLGVTDNSTATAQGFCHALDMMVGGLDKKSVLVLGSGPVGRAAAGCLVDLGALVSVCDLDSSRSAHLAASLSKTNSRQVLVEPDPDQALRSHYLIFDATNAPNVIRTRHISEKTYVAAPGMPCGISAGAREKLSGRMLHDPLQIGVTAMALLSVHQLPEYQDRDKTSQ